MPIAGARDAASWATESKCHQPDPPGTRPGGPQVALGGHGGHRTLTIDGDMGGFEALRPANGVRRPPAGR